MALKHTGVQLHLFTDPDAYLMLENNMRGGICVGGAICGCVPLVFRSSFLTLYVGFSIYYSVLTAIWLLVFE